MTVEDEDRDIRAAELAIGLLDSDEYRKARRLTTIEPDFADDVNYWDDRFVSLVDRVPPMDVPAHLFAQIDARIDDDAARAIPSCEVRRRDEGVWVERAPGARVKVLHASPALNRQTILLELAPETVMQTHTHDIDEECYVISGDIAFGDDELHAGDFHLAPVGSHHGIVRSRRGCLCLIVTAL